MKVLLFITGHGQAKKFDYFNRFLQRLNTLGNICDVFLYCNNARVSKQIVAYYKRFAQTNKHLFITSLNAGHRMGAVEAVSRGIEMGIFVGYDYVIHLHPDVFITDDSKLLEVLDDNIENDCVFLVNKSLPNDAGSFSFDFFIFKPHLLARNILKDQLYSYQGLPEHYLFDMLTSNNVKFKVIKRYDNDDWSPRRIDEHLGLYHEHDLQRAEELLKASPQAETGRRAETPRWQPPIVELTSRKPSET